MKAIFFYRLVIVVLLIAVAGNLTAQDFKGGVVTYQQTTKYDFAKIFGIDLNVGGRRADWIASLPKEHKKVQVLYFTPERALYEEDPHANEGIPQRLQGALARAEYVRPPQTELKKVYYDFGINETVRQIEFMTRHFLITGSIEKQAWKLTNRKIKIQDYICLSAELKQGEDLITVWFTSEIPVSAGPGEFSGLPGLILAVDINGETAFMATSVELTPPQDGAMSKPDKGKKVIQEEFDKTVAEKEKEWKETRSKRSNRR